MTDKPTFNAGTPQRNLVYAWEGEVAELRAENAHLKDELADWRKEGERLRADQQQLCLDIENLKAENERLKAERDTVKRMLKEILEKHGYTTPGTPHYGVGRGGMVLIKEPPEDNSGGS